MVAFGAASRWVAPLRSILVGFGIFSLGSLSDLWLHQHAERLFIAIMADALIGVGVGLLVLLYERRQRQNIIRKLEVIRLMNHHVRNSLQVISFAASSPNQEPAQEVRAASGHFGRFFLAKEKTLAICRFTPTRMIPSQRLWLKQPASSR
jgi:hypothetical protein